MSNKYCYGYLHGFASGPGSRKGVGLKDFLQENFGITLHLFDLNVSKDKPYYLVSDAISQLLHKDLEVLEATNQEPFTWRLIGSSLGAYTAARFANLFPSRVDKLVLLAPAFYLVDIWSSGTNDNLLHMWKEKGLQEFRGPNSELFSVPFDFVQDLQKHPPLVSVACEVTIIHGSDDQVIPLSWIQLVKKQSPQWRLRIVEDDHALMKPHTLQTIEKEIVSCFGFHETKNR